MFAEAHYRRMSPDKDKQTKAPRALREASEAYDQRRLYDLLREIKRKHPGNERLTLVAYNDIPFEIIAETLAILSFENPTRQPLFPDLAFAIIR